MSTLASALDIPDDEPRVWRGLPAAAIAAALWLVVGVVLVRTFALGGMKSANLIVGASLAVPAMVVAWLCAGPHRPRLLAAAVAMVAGVALIPLASHGATPSPARLAEIADAIGLPGSTVRDSSVGNGRCRPSCTELRRVAVAEGSSFVKVGAQVFAALQTRGFTVKVYPHAVGAPQRIDATSKKLWVSIELRQTTLVKTTIAEVFLAQGPAPDHSVGDDVKKP
ncbi:MAG: hypothetical protein QOF21_2757 [Actinomycetota bacterium]|jgi:hypothetical protein